MTFSLTDLTSSTTAWRIEVIRESSTYCKSLRLSRSLGSSIHKPTRNKKRLQKLKTDRNDSWSDAAKYLA